MKKTLSKDRVFFVYKYDMIISHDNKPKFKLQTAYDTLTSRLRGLGYDVDGNIELDTSGYGHGWIKVLRNGRKNNFIYMCSHSDNVDPLCCEPVYRYIKVYNYCDDPKDSNLFGEIPFVVSNIESIPNTTEVYKDDEYKVYKDNASDIVWGYMNLGDGHVAQAPWTSYPTTLKDLSGGNVDFSVPYFDIVDNKGIKLEDGSYSAFDDLFKDEDVLYVGKTKTLGTKYTQEYLHAYMKDHKDPNGVYENIMVHLNDNNSKCGEILNYMLHSKTKTFEYSPKYTWNYDEIINFILYKDENLLVLPSRNGIYHLKTNYYNELNNLSDIGNLENVLDGNTCMHVGYLGDNQMHSAYNVNLNNKDNDISYLQAYPYIQDPYNSRYNYFPNEETQNMLYWNTPKNGFFEGVFQFHNDVIDAVPNKYVWLTLNESAYDVYNNSTCNCDPIQYEPYYSYEGKIDTAEIRKPNTDKEWQWRNNFHNFMTNREVKTIYYKESFSAHDTLSAGSGMTYLANGQENSNVSQNFIFTDRPAIANDYFIKGEDMKIHNNISWNGLSAYRHICRTCSGVGMINPYKHGCNNWANYPYKGQSPFYELQKNDLLCPTCGRTGINIRYLYYKHKYIKPLSMYGLQLNDVADPRISNKNQLLLPTNLMDEDIKKDLILYTTSAEPIGYSACTVYGSKLTYKKAYLGYSQMWNYVDVPRDINNNFQFITDFHQIYPKWDRLTGTEQNKIRKQYQNQLYRGIELPDNFVQYYAFRGQDKNVAGGPKDAWSRIFFDPKWIEKQYFENNTVENPCQYNLKEEIINKGEHNHNHVSQEKYTLNMNNRYYPYYGEVGHHDRDLELDYRKTGVKLQHTCKMCNGEGEIDVYKVNSNGEIIYDIMNNPIIIKDTCPVCNGLGYLEDTYREDYNIAHCDNCHDTGHVVCPTCLGLSTTYKAKKNYTYIESNTIPVATTDSRSNYIVGYITIQDTVKIVQFYTFHSTTIPKSGTLWIPDKVGAEIVYGSGDHLPTEIEDMIELKPCPNCSRYTDLDKGQIPCPECGGVFKYKNTIHGDKEEKHYRIAPGNEDNKKVYKYISINAVSIDNISVEMDNG